MGFLVGCPRDQLSQVFTNMFKLSLPQASTRTCLESSTITHLPH